MHSQTFLPRCVAPTLIAAACAFTAAVSQAATIVISSRDAPGVGFNDPTPVAPVGGNMGTTLGQQRMNVFRYVADLWEAALQSNVTITVNAGWEALTCTDSSAVLGSASAWNIWRDFANGIPGTWYPQALANKLAGVNLSDGQPDDGSGYGNVDIKTQFNINLGQTGCLSGSGFYLGLDGNTGGQVNFVETLLHELGHGLGFSVLTVNTSTGSRLNADGTAYVATGGVPSVWEQFMFDNTVGTTWLNMSAAQRRASAINPLKLAWTGPNAVAGAATTLGGTPSIKISTSVPGANGVMLPYGTASFGAVVVNPGAFGTLVTPVSAANPVGCTAFDAAATALMTGKVAIIDRGTCSFATKAKNAQNAGAIGVVIANNVAGTAPALGGTDPSVVIPTVSVSKDDGDWLKNVVSQAPKYGSRTVAGSVKGAFARDATRIAGADALGRPLLYTPNPLVLGSSVSHWDTSASPNLLMEPNISSDLTITLVPPLDLTVPLLRDLGW